MIISGATIELDHARFAAGIDAFADRADDMAAQRRDVAVAVDTLLRGWRGEAADVFGRLWDEWRDGADTVIGALRSSVDALALAQADLRGADRAAVDVARLSERLR